MNILFINIIFYDLRFLRYRECPYSVTFPYTLLYITKYINGCIFVHLTHYTVTKAIHLK